MDEEELESEDLEPTDDVIEDGQEIDDTNDVEVFEVIPAEAPQDGAPKPAPKAVLIVDDPYDWEQCQITIAITWLPDDGQGLGRPFSIMGRTHMDPPILRFYWEPDMDTGLVLLEAITEVQNELKDNLAEREKAAKVAKEKRMTEEAARNVTRTTRPYFQASPPKPTFHEALFKDKDAMMEMNTSETALKMLKSLVDSPAQEYKVFLKQWKDQPVLEMMVTGLVAVKDDKVTTTEKGKAMYDRALAWKPGAQPSQREAKPVTKPADTKQTSFF